MPRKYQLPSGTTIGAGGFLVFDESQFNPTPGGGASFALNALGDTLLLSAVDGGGELTGYRSQVKFGAAADSVSFGRVLTGNPLGSTTPEFWPLSGLTFGLLNAAPKTGPIIINEVMYHPPDLSGGIDNARDEFIELHNITTSPQNIAGWKFKGDASATFGAIIIQPGDYVLVVAFNPATDAASLAAFRANYGVSASVTIYGPYSPKLGNDSGSIELVYPGTAVGGITPYLLADRVEYLDATPWPAAPDGTGPSLQRESRVVIGNDAGNWAGGIATPGAKNFNQPAILDNDGDGMSNAFEDANALDKFNPADAALDADGDGQSNLAEFLAGTDPRNPASLLSAVVSKIAGGFRVQFTAQVGRGYTIQYRDSLTTGTWLRLADIAAPAVAQTALFNDITASARRFYRIVTPAMP